MTKLDEMWDALATYQSIADDDGHGDTWAEMCRLRTVEACRAAKYAAAKYATSNAAAALATVSCDTGFSPATSASNCASLSVVQDIFIILI